jgi:hypothetical protein
MPTTTPTFSKRSAATPTTPQAEVFWAVRLTAEHDNLLAAWSMGDRHRQRGHRV